MDVFSVAKKYQEKLEREISFLEEQIASAPEGQLKIVPNCNRFKWFVLYGDGHRKYIKKENESFAIALAMKSYYKRQLKVLCKEKKAVDIFLERKNRINDVARNLLIDSGEFARLISLGNGKKNDFVRRWIEEEYEKNLNHPEHLTVRTVNGLYVRSKSEAYIAAELAAHSIPFRYECKRNICGFDIYPDFTIINPITEELILWEHFGMVDYDDYLEGVFSKIRLYIKAGFIPSKNLILTYETREHPLDFSEVQDLIKRYFG